MFMMLLSWHCHCESSPGSFDECSTSAGQAGRSLDQANQLEPQICLNWHLHYYTHHCRLSLLSQKADTRFTILQMVEG